MLGQSTPICTLIDSRWSLGGDSHESPLGSVNEPGGRLLEPLRHPHRQSHVREASGPQIGQPIRCTGEFAGQL